MGIKIVPKFTNADLKGIILSKMERIEAAALSRLQFVGEKFVTNARNNGAYQDRTGNLRSSVGYVILKDGEQIFQNFQTFPQKDPKAEGAGVGAATAQLEIDDLASKLKAEFPRGLILICVAGMDYAAAVEAKGYDVITASSLIAKDDLETGFKELQSKIAQMT